MLKAGEVNNAPNYSAPTNPNHSGQQQLILCLFVSCLIYLYPPTHFSMSLPARNTTARSLTCDKCLNNYVAFYVQGAANEMVKSVDDNGVRSNETYLDGERTNKNKCTKFYRH